MTTIYLSLYRYWLLVAYFEVDDFKRRSAEHRYDARIAFFNGRVGHAAQLDAEADALDRLAKQAAAREPEKRLAALLLWCVFAVMAARVWGSR